MEAYKKGVPFKELNARIKKLQDVLLKKDIQGVLIIEKSDFFYFAGTVQQGWLYVPSEDEPVLMIFKDFKRAAAESDLNTVVSLVSPKKIPETLNKMGYSIPKVLGMELDVLPVNLYLQYQKIFEKSKIIDISMDIRLIRAIKSDYEIEILRNAAAMAGKVSEKVPEFLKEGKTELQLAGQVEAYARSLGHQGIVRMRLWGSELFYGHIMSGKAASIPSFLASPTGGFGANSAMAQGAGFNKIKKNEPILVDYVFALDGYIADQTRIFCISGISDEFLKIHNVMLEIQEMAKNKALPGVLAGDLYEMMITMARDKGCEKYFMGFGDRKIRFTGHGVGLELDEFPFIAKGQKTVIQKNMVIALEPKAIIPEKGVVGIENTFLVIDNGLEVLTKTNNDIVIL